MNNKTEDQKTIHPTDEELKRLYLLPGSAFKRHEKYDHLMGCDQCVGRMTEVSLDAFDEVVEQIEKGRSTAQVPERSTLASITEGFTRFMHEFLYEPTLGVSLGGTPVRGDLAGDVKSRGPQTEVIGRQSFETDALVVDVRCSRGPEGRTLALTLQEKGTGKGLAGVSISCRKSPDTALDEITDKEGEAEFSGLSGGKWEVLIPSVKMVLELTLP